jgi:hypothetical protein
VWGLLDLLAAGDLPGGEEGMGPTRERWGSRGRETGGFERKGDNKD